MRVVGYVRVSTDEQAREGISIPAQIKKIMGYCDLYDLDLAEIVRDEGESAKSLRRPGLAQVRDKLKTGEIGGVVVARLDRLSRNVRDWNELIDEHFNDKTGHRLYSVADSVDTSTATGRMILNVLMTVAQWQRETIVEKTKSALQAKIERGERCGTLKYGYDLAADGVKLVANAYEQNVIRFMQRLKGEGKSFRKIARTLSQRGIKTKSGNEKWTHQAVNTILARV